MRRVATRCPLCDGDDAALVSRRGHPFWTPVRNVVCRTCGLVYQNPIMALEAREAFYQRYRELTIGLATPTPEYETYARPMARYHYSFFREYCRPGMRVLDVGCGAGTLMSWAVEDGLEAYGVNPDPGFGLYGPAHYGLKEVQVCLFEEARFPDGSFDLVTFNHVFEHLPDCVGALSKIRSILRPDGLLYLSVPNVLTPHGFLEYNFFLEHLLNFSPATLTLLLRKMGFRVIKRSTYGYRTADGLHHPYLDVVARRLEVPVPVPIDWRREGEDAAGVARRLGELRAAYLREHGSLRVRLGMLRDGARLYLGTRPRLARLAALARAPLRLLPGSMKAALNTFPHHEPNFSTAPAAPEFPAAEWEYPPAP